MTICAALSTGLSAQSIYPGQHAGKMKKVTTAPIQVESFDLKDVRLLPSRFRDNMMRDSVWMTSIAIVCYTVSATTPEYLPDVKVDI